MPEEQTRKRRRRRRPRGGRRGVATAEAGPEALEKAKKAPSRPERPPLTWQWRTFPVFCAFVAGALLILLIGPEPNTELYSVLFFVFLGGAAFSLAHVVTRVLVARRRR